MWWLFSVGSSVRFRVFYVLCYPAYIFLLCIYLLLMCSPYAFQAMVFLFCVSQHIFPASHIFPAVVLRDFYLRPISYPFPGCPAYICSHIFPAVSVLCCTRGTWMLPFMTRACSLYVCFSGCLAGALRFGEGLGLDCQVPGSEAAHQPTLQFHLVLLLQQLLHLWKGQRAQSRLRGAWHSSRPKCRLLWKAKTRE